MTKFYNGGILRTAKVRGRCALSRSKNFNPTLKGQKEDAMTTTASNMDRSLGMMIGVAVVAILIAITFTGCGGSSPTEPKDPPLPTPTPTPRPAQTFVFTLSATEVAPKEVTAWPGDTIKFVSTDTSEPHQIRGNAGELTSPTLWPASMGGPTEWSTKMVDYGTAKTLTFYDSVNSTNSNYFGKINLQTKY